MKKKRDIAEQARRRVGGNGIKRKRSPFSHKSTWSRQGPMRTRKPLVERDIAERAGRVENNIDLSPTDNVSMGEPTSWGERRLLQPKTTALSLISVPPIVYAISHTLSSVTRSPLCFERKKS